MCQEFLLLMKNCIRFIDLCEKSLFDLINVLGHFQSFCDNAIFVKMNLPTVYFQVLFINQREKSQKYFDLSVLKRI